MLEIDDRFLPEIYNHACTALVRRPHDCAGDFVGEARLSPLADDGEALLRHQRMEDGGSSADHIGNTHTAEEGGFGLGDYPSIGAWLDPCGSPISRQTVALAMSRIVTEM